jgi:hypothetical protein
MKIQNILENIINDESGNGPRFDLVHTNKLNSQSDPANGTLGGSFTIRDHDSGVQYVVDIIYNPQNKKYRLDTINVDDHGHSYEGDAQDVSLVKSFIASYGINNIIQNIQQGD